MYYEIATENKIALHTPMRMTKIQNMGKPDTDKDGKKQELSFVTGG